MPQEDIEDRALLAGFPQRHIDAAVEMCATEGRVVIPAGSPGDLDGATAGMDVLLMISGNEAVPAVTWRATFIRRIAPDGQEMPQRLPPTWLRERQAGAAEADPGVDLNEDDGDDVGPQSFFEVERLEPLPKRDWIFANELVRKQDRGGRAFFPRAPRLIRPPL